MQLFIPKKVCVKKIEFDIENGKLHNVHFTGGCDPHLPAVSEMLEGMEVGEAINKLRAIKCGKKDISCLDQLCEKLKEHKV